ncbi:hypothetical protein EDB85DRAFT_1894214 [Lactarius pseudohatsudake]|nr:hypothetical protein EDB85DRAFT_1894214 [Lactarius pseudohatsudake]
MTATTRGWWAAHVDDMQDRVMMTKEGIDNGGKQPENVQRAGTGIGRKQAGEETPGTRGRKRELLKRDDNRIREGGSRKAAARAKETARQRKGGHAVQTADSGMGDKIRWRRSLSCVMAKESVGRETWEARRKGAGRGVGKQMAGVRGDTRAMARGRAEGRGKTAVRGDGSVGRETEAERGRPRRESLTCDREEGFGRGDRGGKGAEVPKRTGGARSQGREHRKGGAGRSKGREQGEDHRSSLARTKKTWHPVGLNTKRGARLLQEHNSQI